jgi:hypothetical protein
VIGAAAGLAASVGVALLAALALAQARDVRRLAEWAGRGGRDPQRSAPQRVRRLRRVPVRHAALVLTGLLVLGGASSYGVAQLVDGESADRSPSIPKRRVVPVVPVVPAKVTVAVLNGTTVDGLAARLRDEIAAAGFRAGAIAVFPDQQLVASVVEYAPGHQPEARAVGRVAGIGRVRPVSAASRVLAGDATVVIVAGADRAP